MNKPVSSTDTLRHVRFAGRPAAAAARHVKPATPPLSPALPVAESSSEPPGAFISWVFERAGLAAERYRGEPLRRRFSACLRALHAHSEAHARRILEERPDLLPAAVSALLIGTTEFFRDAPVYETLRTEALPKMARRGRPLRVWSAACSSGAELYSLAILLAEAGLLEGSFLLGSDCRHDAIDEATAALYNSHDLGKVAAPVRRKYFEEAGGAWRPVEPLRRRAHWKVADLGRRIEQGPWDVILWRNMGIYLKADAAGSVWQGLISVLAPEGVLVAGRAERPPAELPLIYVGRCVYRACPCHGGRSSGPRSRPANRRSLMVLEDSK